MSGRHHVLLIGIDAYDGGGMLTGCVNDIDHVQRLLIDRVGVPREHIRRLAAPRTGARHETDIPEKLPTLENMRSELTLLGTDDVRAEDRVFIYYSGHGTQCIVADRGRRRFAREALLPKDKKRGAEYRLLFDWEINTLIARIAARTRAVTIVLDCCNSAGATRGLNDVGYGVDRFWPVPEVRLEATELPPLETLRGVASGLGALQQGQVVAACRDDERARETVGDGGVSNGELTRALFTRLMAVPEGELQDLRWGRIWRAVQADVREANARQNPWLSGSFGRRVFGFGPDDETDPGFAIVQVPTGYRVDAGSLAGVTAEAEIGVYGADPSVFPPLASVEDRLARKGTLRVTRAEPGSSDAIAVVPFALPEAPRGRLVRAGPNARLRVALSPDDPRLAAQLAASPLIERVFEGQADLTIARRGDGAWALADDVHGTGEITGDPVLAVIPAERLEVARPAIEHYHAYVAPLRMARACRDLPSLLRLWLLDCGGTTIPAETAQDPDLPQVQPGKRAPYEIVVGERVCFVVENAADVALSVTLFDCAASGRVLLLGEKRLPRMSKHVFWLQDTLGSPFVASLPGEHLVGVDRIAAIATTRPDVSLRYLERHQSFAEILAPPRAARSAFRDRGEATEALVERWTATMTSIRIHRRL